MRRMLLGFGLGIAVLFGGSVAVIILAIPGRPAPAASNRSGGTAASPPPAPPARAGVLEAAPAARPLGPARDPTTPAASRVTRRAVHRALLAAPIQAGLAGCVAGDLPAGDERPPPARPARLTLEFVPLESEVRIVEVRVADFGEASAAAAACAADFLRGRVIAAHVEPAGPARMDFPLNPRSGASSPAPRPAPRQAEEGATTGDADDP